MARDGDAQLPKHLPLALHATALRRSVLRDVGAAPDFVSPTLLAQLRAAHEATGRRAACPVVEQHAVDGMDKTKAVAKLRRAIASPFGSSCIK